jgi:transcriptional regulator with XRE-family HTH domain
VEIGATVGQTIRNLREAHGLTQTQLAQRVLESGRQGTISDWEQDKLDIEPENRLKLAREFGVDPAVLGYHVPQMIDYAEPPPWFTAWADQQTKMLTEIHSQQAAILKKLYAS